MAADREGRPASSLWIVSLEIEFSRRCVNRLMFTNNNNKRSQAVCGKFKYVAQQDIRMKHSHNHTQSKRLQQMAGIAKALKRLCIIRKMDE